MTARESVRAPETLKAGGRGKALALVPLVVGVVFAALLLPRSAPPDLVPVPVVDRAALTRTIAQDHARAERARTDGLPDIVRALGSAIRQFRELEAKDAPKSELSSARDALDRAVIAALASKDEEAVLALRAVQLESYLEEAHRLEATGVESDELHAVAGSLRLLRREGWLRDQRFTADDDTLRVAFKEGWATLLYLAEQPAFQPTLDEERVIYRYRLTHPHPKETEREQLLAQRRGAKDRKKCDLIDAGERHYAEMWRLEKVKRLAAIDPEYPGDYARGVVAYRAGQYGVAADAFRAWIDAHPSGAWTLRAQNHLRAALARETE